MVVVGAKGLSESLVASIAAWVVLEKQTYDVVYTHGKQPEVVMTSLSKLVWDGGLVRVSLVRHSVVAGHDALVHYDDCGLFGATARVKEDENSYRGRSKIC